EAGRAAARLAVELPVDEFAARRVESVQPAPRDVAVVERLFARMPERRLAEQRRRGHGDADLALAHTTAMSSCIQPRALSPGATLTRPWASGSAMWMALLTWLTGSTQK